MMAMETIKLVVLLLVCSYGIAEARKDMVARAPPTEVYPPPPPVCGNATPPIEVYSPPPPVCGNATPPTAVYSPPPPVCGNATPPTAVYSPPPSVCGNASAPAEVYSPPPPPPPLSATPPTEAYSSPPPAPPSPAPSPTEAYAPPPPACGNLTPPPEVYSPPPPACGNATSPTGAYSPPAPSPTEAYAPPPPPSCGCTAPSPAVAPSPSPPPEVYSPPPPLSCGSIPPPCGCRKGRELTEEDVQSLNHILVAEFVLSDAYMHVELMSVKNRDASDDPVVNQMIREFSIDTIKQIGGMFELLRERAAPKPAEIDVSSNMYAKAIDMAVEEELQPEFDAYGSPTNLLISLYTVGPSMVASLATGLLPNLQSTASQRFVSGMLASVSAQDGAIRALLHESKESLVEPYNRTVSEFMQKISTMQEEIIAAAASTSQNELSAGVLPVNQVGFGLGISRSAQDVTRILSTLGVLH